MDENELRTLLNQDESESFDRKRAFPSDNATMIHHILCLSNSLSENDRYLVYGVADDGSIAGIERDPNKKNNAEIHDMLRHALVNRMPNITATDYEIDAHTVTILRIQNRPDKPFYLKKDKKSGDNKQCLRNGVIYTRLGDTNVPMSESAPEEMVELMWRERFGIEKPPLQRFQDLLDDHSHWVEPEEWEPLYHRQFPEFTIVREEPVEDYHEPWMDGFLDPSGRKYIVKVCFRGTVLKTFIFISCDGGRVQMPQPKMETDGKFAIYCESADWKIAELLNRRSVQLAGKPIIEFR